MKTHTLKAARRTLLVAAASAALLAAVAAPAMATGRWVTGDIHNHTVLTDGSNVFTEVTRNAFSVYGLDYLANSEHGGTSTKDAAGLSFVSPVWRWITLSNYSFPQVMEARSIYPERRIIQGVEWNAPTHEHVSVGIVGAGNEPSGISNFEYHFDASDTDLSRAGEGTKAVTHTESDPTDPTKTITVVDVPAMTFGKYNTTNQDTLTAIDWLEQNYGPQSYAIVNHPSRKLLWSVGDFRAMNDVAPDVAIGFEGLPGHQASQARGEYGNFIDASGKVVTSPTKTVAAAPGGATEAGTTVTITTTAAHGFNVGDKISVTGVKELGYNGMFTVAAVPSATSFTYVVPDVDINLPASGAGTASLVVPPTADAAMTAKARTYGGADWMTAQVGGLWDSLLGEGRHWWIFNNSDYHTVNTAYKDAAGNTIGLQYADFWPGQYAKTYTYTDQFTDQGVVDGMRSGDSFVVNGDLINGMKYTVSDGKRTAMMGDTLKTKAGKTLTISISVKSPKDNNNGDPVKLDHVDVISGAVTGLISASDPTYLTKNTNDTTKVAKTFNKSNWKKSHGWMTMTYKVKASGNMYFRLRGTNWKPGMNPTQIDDQGNPVVDTADYVDYPNPVNGGLTNVNGSTPDNAWADLWFYSNPVFVHVK
jgi:hypothetical protein